jgi:mannose-6-phosphate isomerase
LFLNIVELESGQALYQGAGELHAYLEGFGLELMANSDNVLRGGLTPKHIDVPELMRVLDFRSSVPEILQTQDTLSGIRRFFTPASEFSLGLLDLEAKNHTLPPKSGPMILIVLTGEVTLFDGSDKIDLVRGGSVFIPWNAGELILSGRGQVALAGVGE